MSVSDSKKCRVHEMAGSCCEYYLISKSPRLIRFHVDHIVARNHGDDDDNNLCLACYECNGYKGENVAALDPCIQLY